MGEHWTLDWTHGLHYRLMLGLGFGQVQSFMLAISYPVTFRSHIYLVFWISFKVAVQPSGLNNLTYSSVHGNTGMVLKL